MNFFSRYCQYLHDNPENLWFKRKLYGWGWVPVRWQGWAVVAAFIVFMLGNSQGIDATQALEGEMFWFLARTVLAVIVLIAVCYKTGEAPRWQWGLPDNNKKLIN